MTPRRFNSKLISDPAGPDNRIGYAGYVFNPETLIYTVRHRHYDPMLGRFMSTDWLGYADGMNLYEYVGGRAMNFNDPSGLAWYNPLTWGLGGADESDIQATKDKYCQSQKDEYGQGKMCKDEFEKRWKNGGCGQSVSSEISDAAITGFGQGAHDGYVKTSHSAVNAMTFGLLDEIAPLYCRAGCESSRPFGFQGTPPRDLGGVFAFWPTFRKGWRLGPLTCPPRTSPAAGLVFGGNDAFKGLEDGRHRQAVHGRADRQHAA